MLVANSQYRTRSDVCTDSEDNCNGWLIRVACLRKPPVNEQSMGPPSEGQRSHSRVNCAADRDQ
jgi:hypothetical protein